MNKMVVMYLLCGVVLIAGTFGGLWMKQKNDTAARESVTTSGVPIEPTARPTPSLSSAETVKEQSIRLVITTPANQYVSATGSVIVQGSTVPNAEVNVNDIETTANASGNFTVTVSLDEGENTIMIVANDADGKAAEKDIVVTYIPSE